MKKLIITVFLVVLSANSFLPKALLYAKEFSSSTLKSLQKNESLYSAQILSTNNYAYITKNVAMYDNPARSRSNYYSLYHNNQFINSYAEVAYYKLYENGSIIAIAKEDYISKPMWFVKSSKSTNVLIFDEIELIERSLSKTRSLAFMRLDGLGYIISIADGEITELGTYISLVDSVISDNGEKFAFVVMKEDGLFYLIENITDPNRAASTIENTTETNVSTTNTINTNTINGVSEHLIEDGSSISSLVITEDGRRLIYKKYKDGQYFLVDGENVAGPYKEINNIVFSANGNNLAYSFKSLPITNVVEEVIEARAIVTNTVVSTNYSNGTVNTASNSNNTATASGNSSSANSTAASSSANTNNASTTTNAQNTSSTNYNTNSQTNSSSNSNSSTQTTNNNTNTNSASSSSVTNVITDDGRGYINYFTDDDESTSYSISFLSNSTDINVASLYSNLLSILLAQQYDREEGYSVVTNEVIMQTNIIEINEKETIIEQEGETLVLNGKILGVYDSITNVGFSQNSKSFLYFIKKDDLTYITDNNNKTEGYSKISAYKYSDDGLVFSYSADNKLIVNSNLIEIGVDINNIYFLNDNSVLYIKKIYDRFVIHAFDYESAAYNEIVSISFLKSNLENTFARDNFVFIGIRGNKYYAVDRRKTAHGPYKYISPVVKINSIFYSIASNDKEVVLLEY